MAFLTIMQLIFSLSRQKIWPFSLTDASPSNGDIKKFICTPRFSDSKTPAERIFKGLSVSAPGSDQQIARNQKLWFSDQALIAKLFLAGKIFEYGPVIFAEYLLIASACSTSVGNAS